MKICLACSPGGHLQQIMQLEKIFMRYDHFFLTFRRGMTEELSRRKKVHFIIDPKRNPLKVILNSLQNLFIFLKEKPNLIISTGAGVIIFMCIFSKIFGRKVIFIESFSRVDRPSLTGRIVYHFSDLFIVQWELLLKFYKNATYGGSIF